MEMTARFCPPIELENQPGLLGEHSLPFEIRQDKQCITKLAFDALAD